MIDKEQIDAKADELGVNVANVQRDYVFGWLLSGFYQPDNPLHSLLVLKGGNCFRKAYFEHARFSNDLDFSIQTELNRQQFLNAVKHACTFAGERSGVEFLIDDSRIAEKRLADSEMRVYEARIYFRSFYGEEDARLRVTLDLSEYDRIFLPVQERQLIHAYPDATLCRATLRCLKLEELLASKLKALLQRRHSPDLYDFVHAVFFQKVLAISRSEVLTTFLKQTIYESDPVVAKNLLLQLPFQIIRGFWDQYIICPRFSLFTFDDAESWFKTTVGEIFALAVPRFAFAGVARAQTLNYFPSDFRDVIMEAGRLRRLVTFIYDGLERRVEPYALAFKRRLDGVGKEYFYGWDQTGGRSGKMTIKMYTADKVQSIAMSQESFEPRYPIELTKSGEYFTRPYFARPTIRLPPPPRQRQRRGFSTAYTIQCPVCRRKFKRATYDTELRDHKDKYGNRCYGRIGYVVW